MTQSTLAFLALAALLTVTAIQPAQAGFFLLPWLAKILVGKSTATAVGAKTVAAHAATKTAAQTALSSATKTAAITTSNASMGAKAGLSVKTAAATLATSTVFVNSVADAYTLLDRWGLTEDPTDPIRADLEHARSNQDSFLVRSCINPKTGQDMAATTDWISCPYTGKPLTEHGQITFQ